MCGGCGGATTTGGTAGFAARDGVVVVAGEVGVPVAFAVLQEFEVVLHFAFDELVDGDDAVDAVAGETVWWGVGVSIWGRGW